MYNLINNGKIVRSTYIRYTGVCVNKNIPIIFMFPTYSTDIVMYIVQ